MYRHFFADRPTDGGRRRRAGGCRLALARWRPGLDPVPSLGGGAAPIAPGALVASEPTFEWSRGIDDMSGVDRYRLVFATRDDFDTNGPLGGQVIATRAERPTTEQIETALGAFRGLIQQVPPQFSAVKVEGERAYDIARTGEAMDLAARPLMVESLDLLTCPDPDTAHLPPAS